MARISECFRCSTLLPEGERFDGLCSDCRILKVFGIVARVAGRAIMSQPNLLLRVRLITIEAGIPPDLQRDGRDSPSAPYLLGRIPQGRFLPPCSESRGGGTSAQFSRERFALQR
jgi:hypothetical protein